MILDQIQHLLSQYHNFCFGIPVCLFVLQKDIISSFWMFCDSWLSPLEIGKFDFLFISFVLSSLTTHLVRFFSIVKKLISYDLKIIVHFRVSIRKTFAQFFAERNAKFFFLCASVLREKTTFCAIIRKSHFAQNCPIPFLRNSSFAQFGN